MELRARSPFEDWPRQWVRAEYGFVWTVEQPAVIVTQAHFEHATVTAVDALHDVLDEIVGRKFLEQHPGALMIHDWRSIRSVGPNVRERWSYRSGRRPNQPFRSIERSYIAVTSSSVMRMTVQTAALAIQLSTGQAPMKIIADPAVPLAAHKITAPSR